MRFACVVCVCVCVCVCGGCIVFTGCTNYSMLACIFALFVNIGV